MIKLCNTEFYNVTHVKRAYELLSKRGKEKPHTISQYELKLGKTMHKYLNQRGGR